MTLNLILYYINLIAILNSSHKLIQITSTKQKQQNELKNFITGKIPSDIFALPSESPVHPTYSILPRNKPIKPTPQAYPEQVQPKREPRFIKKGITKPLRKASVNSTKEYK
jgi:hypothetical protein